MKKLIIVCLLNLCALSFYPLFCQDQSSIYPYYYPGAEEFIYHNLALGGWNVLGPFSPRGTAMGETFFASLNSTSGYFNPAFLTFVTRPQFSLNYRYSENTYKTSFGNGIVPLRYWDYGWGGETHSFVRKTDRLDSAGFVLPFEDWVFAANYFLFQDYNFPDIEGSNYSWPEKVQQSGEMKGVNFAFAYRLTASFSLGVSASYVFGDISRFQKYYPIYILYAGVEPGWYWNSPVDILPPWPWYYGISEKYSLNLKGLSFNIGFTFAPSDKLRVGLMLKPPFSINVKAEAEFVYNYYDYVFPNEYFFQEQIQKFSGEFYFKQPLVVVSSVFFKPLESLSLTADLSFWGWSNASTDYMPGYYYPYDFKNILKLNLGAEYVISLPFEKIDKLSLRAGYIYDPQPYQPSESFARNYFCTGFGLSVWHFELDAAAKLSLSAKELRHFSYDVLQVGLSYRF